MIAEKMSGIEQRLVKSDVEVQNLTSQQKQETGYYADAEEKNKALFFRLQESIAQQ